MKQIALACLTYADSNRDTLPMISDSSFTSNTQATTDCLEYGARFFILPYVEQTPLYESLMVEFNNRVYAWATPNALKGAEISNYKCPSDANSATINDNYSPSNYVFSYGDYCVKDEDWGWNLGSPPTNWSRGAFQPRNATRLSGMTDGTSNTISVSECVAASGSGNTNAGANTTGGKVKGSYAQASDVIAGTGHTVCETSGSFVPQNCLSTVLSGNEFKSTVSVNNASRCVRWLDGQPAMSGFNTILPPNAPACSGPSANHYNPALLPPQSNHTGGVNAARVDGSVSFVSDTIDTGNLTGTTVDDNTGLAKRSGRSNFGVWGAFGSRDGGEAETPP